MSLPYYLLIDCLQSSDKPKLIRYAMSLDLVLTLNSTFNDWYYKTGIEQFSRPKTLTLIHSQMEERLRHARGPVHAISHDINITTIL